jgi:small subunit ribosomal protein S7
MTELKLFGLFSLEDVNITDYGLKKVINIQPKLLTKSHGRGAKKEFSQAKMHIIERLINRLQIPGSRGKKHRIITSWQTGKYNKCAKIVIDAFKIIEEKTKQNPVSIFVKAVENASPREEVTSIEYGGARYPQAVDTSPIRRINLVLRFMCNGAYDKAFNKKVNITEALAKEIMDAAAGSMDSFAFKKKNEIEKQADAAR